MLGHQKRTATLTNNGTGLGLTISNLLVKIYNGQLKIDSNHCREFSTIAQFSMKFKQSEESLEQKHCNQSSLYESSALMNTGRKPCKNLKAKA